MRITLKNDDNTRKTINLFIVVKWLERLTECYSVTTLKSSCEAVWCCFSKGMSSSFLARFCVTRSNKSRFIDNKLALKPVKPRREGAPKKPSFRCAGEI